MNIQTKIECVKREVKRRKKIYPHLVEQGKITQEEQDFEIAVMQSVLETLTQLSGLVNS